MKSKCARKPQHMMQKKECVLHPRESVGHSLQRPRRFSSAAAAAGCLLQAIDEVDCMNICGWCRWSVLQGSVEASGSTALAPDVIYVRARTVGQLGMCKGHHHHTRSGGGGEESLRVPDNSVVLIFSVLRQGPLEETLLCHVTMIKFDASSSGAVLDLWC